MGNWIVLLAAVVSGVFVVLNGLISLRTQRKVEEVKATLATTQRLQAESLEALRAMRLLVEKLALSLHKGAGEAWLTPDRGKHHTLRMAAWEELLELDHAVMRAPQVWQAPLRAMVKDFRRFHDDLGHRPAPQAPGGINDITMKAEALLASANALLDDWGQEAWNPVAGVIARTAA